MPDTWSYHSSFLTTNSRRCFCVAKRKKPYSDSDDYMYRTNASIYHYWGKFLRTDLLESIEIWDPEFDQSQFSRDLKIKEILND